MEDLLLRWENQMETAINLALFILSHAIPLRGQERGGKCAAQEPGAARRGGQGCRIRNETEFTQNHGERRKEPLERLIHPVC